MPMFTRRHYETFARDIRSVKELAIREGDLFGLETAQQYEQNLADKFELDNGRFNRSRFIDACKPQSTHGV